MRKTILTTLFVISLSLLVKNTWAFREPGEHERFCGRDADCTYENGHLIFVKYGAASGEDEYRYIYNENGKVVEYQGSYDSGDYSESIKWDPTGTNKVEEWDTEYDELSSYTKYDAVTGNKIQQCYCGSCTKYNETGLPIENNYVDISFDNTGSISITETGQKYVYTYETNEDGELVGIMIPGKDYQPTGEFYETYGARTVYNSDGSVKSEDLFERDEAFYLNCDERFEFFEETGLYHQCNPNGDSCADNPIAVYSSITNIFKGKTTADEEAAKNKTTHTIKRIYTIDEANAVAGKTNTFSIRYR